MPRYGRESKLGPQEVMGRTGQFFGLTEIGQEVKERVESCGSFEHGGDHIFIQVCQKGGDAQVDLEMRE